DAPELEREASRAHVQGRVFGPRVHAESRLRLAMPVGGSDAARIEVEALAELTHELDVHVPAAQHAMRGVRAEDAPQLVARDVGEDDLVEGIRRAVEAEQRAAPFER